MVHLSRRLGSGALTVDDLPSRQRLLLLAAVAVALQALLWAVMVPLFTAHVGYGVHDLSDVPHYLSVVERIGTGKWPYVDFPFEYPPLALPVFLLPLHDGTLATYEYWFGLEMIVACCASAAVVALIAARTWEGLARPFAATAAFTLTVGAAGALSLNRFDPVVGLIVCLAVLALIARRTTLAGVAVGLGFALKLTPIVLLPPALVLAPKRRSAAAAAAAAAAAGLLPFIPFLLRSAHAFSAASGYQGARGLQVESLAATPYLVASRLTTGAIGVDVPTGGSLEIHGPGTAHVAAAAPFVMLLLLIAVYLVVWRVRRGLRHDPEGIVLASLTVLLAVLCGNKVLSPQHLLWALPLVALCLVARAGSQKAVGALMLGAVALTQIEFPAYYHATSRLETVPVVLISVRNALVLAAFIVGLVRLWRLRRGAEPDPEGS